MDFNSVKFALLGGPADGCEEPADEYEGGMPAFTLASEERGITVYCYGPTGEWLDPTRMQLKVVDILHFSQLIDYQQFVANNHKSLSEGTGFGTFGGDQLVPA